MRGGNIILESDLRFADDKNMTGSGNVKLKGHSLWMGAKPI